MSTENSDKRNCPYCGKEASAKALICPACDKNISVGVIAVKIDDNSKRHKIIKTLLQLEKGEIFKNYSKLNELLKIDNSVIVEGISFYYANQIKNEFQKLHLDVKIEPIQFLGSSKEFEEKEKHTYNHEKKSKHFIEPLLLLILLSISIFYFVKKYYIFQPKHDETASIRTIPDETNTPTSTQYLERAAPTNIKDKINRLVSATVLVMGNSATGSGFIIRQDGYILTNHHVIDGQSDLTVKLEDGRKFTARVEKIQPSMDLALLKIDAQNLPILKLGDATKLKRGDDIWTIGAPKQLAFSVSKGIVSFVGRNINNIYYIQSDVAINPGNSGGPMINESGEAIGINSFMITESEGLNFALPINYTYMGKNAIASSIIDYNILEQAPDLWSQESKEGITATFKQPPKNISPQTKSDNLAQYDSRAKELTSNFKKKDEEITNEREILVIKKTQFEDKYNNKYSNLSISEEANVGKEILELETSITQKDIELLELRQNYNNDMVKVLKDMTIFVNNKGDADTIQQNIEYFKKDLDIISERLKVLNKELNDKRGRRS